jgi:putative addiction module component (TIGR02574 family)
MLAASDIKRMSLTEHLQSMELLWKSISGSAKALKSPRWHGDILARRLAKVETGKGRFLSVSSVKARLRKNR